jgi:hypothetical protein
MGDINKEIGVEFAIDSNLGISWGIFTEVIREVLLG